MQISSVQFNFEGTEVLTGSIDTSARIWDVRTGQCMSIKEGHSDEVLDVCYNASGSQLATASSDSTVRVYDTGSGALLHSLQGHTGEVSKVCSNRSARLALQAHQRVHPRKNSSAIGWQVMSVLPGVCVVHLLRASARVCR